MTIYFYRFHDNITLFWDAEVIALHVKPFIEDNEIDIVSLNVIHLCKYNDLMDLLLH